MRLRWRRPKTSDYSCAQLAAALQTLLDEELPADEAAKAMGHLEGCRKCGLEAEAYQQIKSVLGGLREDPEATTLIRLRDYADSLTETRGGE